MRLESITLHGFKSFGERTQVDVLPGITAIVGPNGCGKSNISESVRWALGEQSAKSLRGQRMEDLIFHGSASRKPVGLAEVELRFANDGALSVPWSEISVMRRVYRTGESEYLLNRAPARLRDILDLFAGTGANPRAYSVMDQDKLNHVLTAKPHERRIFIEEAAGIARYKQQRNETQGKLEATRQNLVRVKDVMDEVRRQLGSLERQAKRARQYKALAEERRAAALAVAAADHAALLAECHRLEADLSERRDREQELRTRIGHLSAGEAAQREALQASDHRLGDLRQALHKVQAEMERLLERREQVGVQLRDAAEEAVRLDQDLQATGNRLVDLAAERDRVQASFVEAERLVAERRQTAAVLEERVERSRAALAGERDRLEALRLAQVRVAGERTDLMRSAGELRERQSQLGRRVERLSAELIEAEAEAQRLLAGRTSLEAARDQIHVQLQALLAERRRLADALMGAEHALGEAERDLADARLALAARQSSLDALRSLELAREGYTPGVRALFADGGQARVPGVVGTVADLLDVPHQLERAVEAALGERLEWVVVGRFEEARAGVEFLQAQGAGSATFLPLDHLPPGAALPPDNGVRWLARHVGASTPSLLAYLLGPVALVENLDNAEALWRRNGIFAIYVTPAGEVLGPTGRLSARGDGPERASVESSLLARKRRIRELEDEVRDLVERVATGHEAVARLGAEVAGLRADVPRLDARIKAGESEQLTGEKDLQQTIREQERVHRHAGTVRLESAQVTGEAAETATILEQLELRIAAVREAETAHERTMAALRAEIEAAQADEGALGAELTACRVDVASIAERVEALAREQVRLEQMQADMRARAEQARERQRQLADRQVWLAEERERTDAAAREVSVDRDRAEAEARTATESHEERLAALRALEQELRGVEADCARIVAAAHALELQLTERRVRGEELVQETQRSFGLDAEALATHHDPGLDVEGQRTRVRELDDKMAGIGAVNLVADEEYRELDERLTFLRTQHDDLTASIKDLEKALRGMTRTAQERFLHAFQEIGREFSKIYERLFEGGRAELRLVEAEEGGDPLDTGVELMAQPRGKRLQAVTLLSGGERALTGLALLFAIFYYRPSPFCVLDEVDAPLDDANIHRFLRVLRELTERTQFLVITHNRRTMEAADILYGVTMEEPGLSKLVSVRLHQ
jgi:chromosome segregation protein